MSQRLESESSVSPWSPKPLLTLCSLRFGYNGLDKSMEDWCWAEDLECFEDAVTEVLSILFGAVSDERPL
jgi:hypothetical protein